MATATFGAGCFWGVEQAFRRIEGIADCSVGYMGGTLSDPSYEQVCTGETGHAEVCQVTFDPGLVPYETLLATFWDCHDPTQFDGQGPDIGPQYRSAIFVHDDAQRAAAEASRDALTASGRFRRPIATEITDATTYWRAEDDHQRYYDAAPTARPINLIQLLVAAIRGR